MSITLGIYDFFAYLIPGLLYLFVFNEFLRSIGRSTLNIVSWFRMGQAPDIILFVPILIGAYIIGQIFDPLAQRVFFKFIYRFRYPDGIDEHCLNEMKKRCSSLDVQFQKSDWATLFTFIRQRNIEMAHILDKLNADGIMLINIALSMLLLTLIQVGIFFSNKELVFLLNALGTMLLCLLAMSRSNRFRIWFFSGIFEASLEYGTSLKKVAEYTIKVDGEESTSRNRSNTRPHAKRKKMS